MKQMKILSVLVGMMALLVSCEKDNNSVRQGFAVAQVTENTGSSLGFLTYDGYTLRSKEGYAGLSKVEKGDFVYIIYSYDSETDVEETSGVVNVSIDAAQDITGLPVVRTTVEEAESYASNRPIITIADGNLAPQMFDNEHLVVPIQFYWNGDLTKHSFRLVYYSNRLKGDKNGKDKNEGLTLYLHHTSSETSQPGANFSYQVYDLRQALEDYKEAYESYPSKIYLETENSVTMDNKLPTTTTTTAVSYVRK